MQRITSLSDYFKKYEQSVKDPEKFWAEIADTFIWKKKWDKVLDWDFDSVDIKWFKNAKLNITENILEKNLIDRADKTAIIWEPNDPTEPSIHLTYKELYEETCKFSNALREKGIKKGDRVIIYMPMVPEAAIAMLACARVGAVHSVVFAGFSSTSLADRINDCQAKMVLTSDGNFRGNKTIPVKPVVDEALEKCKTIESVIVLERTKQKINMTSGRDFWWHDCICDVSSQCDPEILDSEDMLFILYTSGSTGKPKGVLHTTAGYLLGAHMSFKYLFGINESDVYWCTADVGWITGHTYILYGPLSNGTTTIMFEGVPTYPSSSRCWEVCDKYNVNVFYTAPTAIRALMSHGDEPVLKTKRDSLRVLGTVGEPINPEAWDWYHKVVGNGSCDVIDTWWQTETGSVLISPISGVTPVKPGSATLPFFGVKPAIYDEEGQALEGAASGNLVIESSWPSQIRSVYGDHERMISTYFKTYEDIYFTGDGARRDEDGYFWITGRVDDVLNVSGHRLGTAEIESALVLHDSVAEAAVVGFQHPIKGQGIYAFVTLMKGEDFNDALEQELTKFVSKEIGPIAKPDLIQNAPGLPKTRSGKIMRRILRKIAEGDFDNLGDTTTLAEPAVVESLLENSKKL